MGTAPRRPDPEEGGGPGAACCSEPRLGQCPCGAHSRVSREHIRFTQLPSSLEIVAAAASLSCRADTCGFQLLGGETAMFPGLFPAAPLLPPCSARLGQMVLHCFHMFCKNLRLPLILLTYFKTRSPVLGAGH